jgi:hypothetical protein
MAITSSPRLGLTRWSDDADVVSRAQFDSDNGDLDALVAIAIQGLAADRPAASVPRRLYYATDTGALSFDTGSAWVGLALLSGAAFTGTIDVPELGVTGPNGRGRLFAPPEAGRNYLSLEGPGGTTSFTAYAADDALFPGRWAILNALTQFCLSATAPDKRDIRAHGNVDVQGGITVAGDVTRAGSSLPRGTRAFSNAQGTSGDLGDNALVPGYAISFTAETGRLYRVTASAATIDDQAGTTGTFAGSVDFRIRSENGATAVGITSAVRGARRVPLTGNGAQNAHPLLVVGYINNPPAGNVNVALTGQLVAPATLWRVLQAAGEGSLIVEDIGAAR